MTHRRALLLATVAALIVALLIPAMTSAAAKTKRSSTRSDSAQGQGASKFWPAISKTGRYVAFRSSAENLVKNDDNGYDDVFVKDHKTGRTRLVSLSSSEKQGNDESAQPSISANGRFVAFRTLANDLFPNDGNSTFDIVVRDRKKGKTKLVSKSSAGVQGNSGSFEPAISADGRYVTFYSISDNLVPHDDNSVIDVFVHDRRTKKTRRVSVGPGGVEGDGPSGSPAISADGRFIAFSSEAKNLIGSDTNGTDDVFVRDMKRKKTKRVSVATGGGQSDGPSFDPAISASGRFVAFRSVAENLIGDDSNGLGDIFVRDRRKRKTKRVSISSKEKEADGSSAQPSISANGRYVAFESGARNLVGNDTNVAFDAFVRDRKKGKTKRASLRHNGKQAMFDSRYPRISGDGRFVAFTSGSPDLIKNDTNAMDDTFRRGPL